MSSWIRFTLCVVVALIPSSLQKNYNQEPASFIWTSSSLLDLQYPLDPFTCVYAFAVKLAPSPIEPALEDTFHIFCEGMYFQSISPEAANCVPPPEISTNYPPALSNSYHLGFYLSTTAVPSTHGFYMSIVAVQCTPFSPILLYDPEYDFNHAFSGQITHNSISTQLQP